MPRIGGALDVVQVNEPAAPVPGRQMLFFKSDGVLYSKTAAGVVTAIGAAAAPTNMVTTDTTQTGLTATRPRIRYLVCCGFSAYRIDGGYFCHSVYWRDDSSVPLTGTFAKGDVNIAQNGVVYVCTIAGSPGTWTRVDKYNTVQKDGGTGFHSRGTLNFITGTFVAPTVADDSPNQRTSVAHDLSATGTPSATTFLRGDNTWAVATPAAHAATHATGSTDPITPTDIGAFPQPTGTTSQVLQGNGVPSLLLPVLISRPPSKTP